MSGVPASGQVRWEVEPGGVAWLTIDRPDKGNAISPDERNAIIELLEAAGDNAAIRAIVVTGAGDRHFCTGGDLGHPLSVRSTSEVPFGPGETVRLIGTGIQRLFRTVLDCPKPTIAAVNGTAAGIGAHLAFACDLVVAADDVRFIEIFVRRGLVPDGAGAYLLPRLVGLHVAKELLFFGDDLPADEAVRLGLVNRAVPRAELDGFVRQWADRLAAGPTVMLSLTKAMINRSLDLDRDAVLRDEALSVEVNSRTSDFVEGQKAFLEKRPVRFRGS